MNDFPIVALAPALIVEDDAFAQQRLRGLLTDVAGVDARIDAAGTLADARRLATGDVPYALALVDVQLPDGCGVDFIAWLRRARPALPTVIVSSWAEEGTILAALRHGASGYLLKHAEDIELAMQLRCLHRGGAAIDPVIARRLLALLPQAEPPPAAGETIHLSARETEILGLVARGLSNREIADNTGLSRLTIETHTRNIYRKLEVGSRTAAVFEAQALGLLH